MSSNYVDYGALPKDTKDFRFIIKPIHNGVELTVSYFSNDSFSYDVAHRTWFFETFDEAVECMYKYRGYLTKEKLEK